MPDQVHVGVAQPQRLVDLEGPRPRRSTLSVHVGQLSGVPHRLAVVEVRGPEIVQRHAERGQVGRRRPGPEPVVVVLLDGVAEARVRPGDQDPVAVPAVPGADRDPDQQGQQGEVEDQVAGLLDVPLLGADRDRPAVLGPHGRPPPLRPQGGPQLRRDLGRCSGAGTGRRCAATGPAGRARPAAGSAGCAGGGAAGGPGSRPARRTAAGRWPRTRPRSTRRRTTAGPATGPIRGARAGRRPRSRGSRCVAGATIPVPPRSASSSNRISAVRMLVSERQNPRASRTRSARITAPPPRPYRGWTRSQIRKSPQTPVARPSPTRISRPPPTRVTQTLLRRMARCRPISLRKPSPKARNGRPRPRQYATVRVTARPADPATVAIAMTAPKVGPMHGAHPSAKTAPSTGALASPAAGSRWMRHSRCIPGSKPRNDTPSTMMSRPTTIWTACGCTSRARPRLDTSTLVRVNTTVYPATKPALPKQDPAAGGGAGAVQRVVQVGPGQTGHVGQIAGYQRQHARRQEADQPGDRGHRDGQHQRPGVGDAGERLTHGSHRSPPASWVTQRLEFGLQQPAPHDHRDAALPVDHVGRAGSTAGR